MNGTKEYEKKFGQAFAPKATMASSTIEREAMFQSLDSSILIEQFRGLSEKLESIKLLADY